MIAEIFKTCDGFNIERFDNAKVEAVFETLGVHLSMDIYEWHGGYR